MNDAQGAPISPAPPPDAPNPWYWGHASRAVLYIGIAVVSVLSLAIIMFVCRYRWRVQALQAGPRGDATGSAGGTPPGSWVAGDAAPGAGASPGASGRAPGPTPVVILNEPDSTFSFGFKDEKAGGGGAAALDIEAPGPGKPAR